MPLSDAEVLAAIDDRARQAYGAGGELAGDREAAINYYLGKPYGNEVEGRSQVVTRDVLETVEWILPDLIEIFTAGDKAVEFTPKGQEDEEAADQETDYVNHVVMQQNDSFMTLYSWFKDALLLKVGYVKIYWDVSEDITEDTYENLSAEELTMLAQDQAVEIVAAEQTPFGFNVVLKRNNKVGKVCIEAVPPEEMLIDMSTRSLDLGKSTYVEHRTKKTLSEIRLMGFDVDDNIASSDSLDGDDSVATARNIYEEDDWDLEGADPATRQVWFRDITIEIDADGDGIAERMRYYVVGNRILYKEKAQNVYYAALGPVPMPHRHVGLSIADLVMDLQYIRSTVMRQYLDGLYLQNNGRYGISDKVNLDDMLTSRPGGVVRINTGLGESASQHIMPLTHPATGSFALEGLGYLDSMKEVRTGVSKNEQGLDADALHKTSSGMNMVMTAAMRRKKLIARIFAETGIKRAFTLTHELLKKHSDKQTIYRLRNKWIPVDPRQWQTRTDMRITVGLGTGSKDMQLQHLMSIMQVQEKGMVINITEPKKIYNAAKRLAENAGFSDGDEFFTDPSTQPPKPQQPPVEIQVEQMRQQGDAQKFQAQAVLERQKAEANLQQEQARSTNDIMIEREKFAAEMEFKRWEAELKVQSAERMKMMELQYSTVQPTSNL